MSENTKCPNTDLLRYLTEQEQETLAAGLINILGLSNLFLQQTNIQSEADNKLNLASGDVSSQKTKYTLSQFTVGASIIFLLPKF